MRYETYRYIYPTRPKNCIPSEELDIWSDNMLAQPKLNGSNCLIFTNGDRIIAMNRHNQRLTNFQLSTEEIKDIYKGNGWCVLNGEYMNKGKFDEKGVLFNHKLVLFDILVYNGDYLVGKTFQERVNLLDNLYGKEKSDKSYLYQLTDNIYRVVSYENNFKSLFGEITKIDMVEGLVLKRKNAKLEIGNTENNNTKSQIKSRKQTKLYKF